MDVWGHRALVCVLVVGLVVVGSGTAAVADTHSAESEAVAADDLGDADEIQVTINIHENRSATVEVDYRYQLDGNDSSVDWDRLADDVNSSPEAYVAVENESWQETVDRASNETDREMELSRFSVRTDRSQTPVELGHVRFRFQWSSFAYGEPRYMEAGDALVGFTLVDHTRLTITWPESYNATELRPEPTARDASAAHWDGSESMFEDPRIELIQTGSESGPGGGDLGLGLSWQMGALLGAVAVAFVAAIGAAGWILTRGRQRGVADGTLDSNDGVEAGNPTAPPSELLSNEEQVVGLLEQHGGRLKQQQVVAELDWTEAKTSQVVTGLREAGEIDVFRIGRENVLVLAEEER